jgi:hypothetical protein
MKEYTLTFTKSQSLVLIDRVITDQDTAIQKQKILRTIHFLVNFGVFEWQHLDQY